MLLPKHNQTPMVSPSIIRNRAQKIKPLHCLILTSQRQDAGKSSCDVYRNWAVLRQLYSPYKMRWGSFLVLIPFQQSSEQLTAESSVSPAPLSPSTQGRFLQLLETSWIHRQRLHRPDISFWHMAPPQTDYIHTWTNKLFRKLLETVFLVSIFSSTFPDPHFSQVHPLMPWDLKGASFIPIVLSTGSLWATQHTWLGGLGWCRALFTGAFQKKPPICKITLSCRKKAKQDRKTLW